ncbi:trihelix transcription factor GT-3b-like [Euphorbia lathyris]|uniref:trihelix transcription factor GT-3b-like n=1 Tax=Euphorbia lathyris TaxID=212925 RepID=UPI003313ED91
MFSGGDNDPLRPVTMKAASTMRSPTPEILPSMSKERISAHQQQLQWAEEETKELIRIRADLEKDFTVAKRNKALWEIVSLKMRERGYRRTPDQCKCKWKNLINRYKGKETSDPENGMHCPFFEELHAVFNERAKNMQRLLLESEGSIQKRKRGKRSVGSFDEVSEDEDEDEDGCGGERLARGNSRKRKGEKLIAETSTRVTSTSTSDIVEIQEMLKEFFQQQQRMEMQWLEMIERRAHEQRLFEQEWRQSMEKIERERLMIEQAWREREEQRRIREESRAERRDALLTTLLNKLIREDDSQVHWDFS